MPLDRSSLAGSRHAARFQRHRAHPLPTSRSSDRLAPPIAPQLAHTLRQPARRARQAPRFVRYLVDPGRRARFPAASSRVGRRDSVTRRQSPPSYRHVIRRRRPSPPLACQPMLLRRKPAPPRRLPCAPAHQPASARHHSTRARNLMPERRRYSLPPRRHVAPSHRDLTPPHRRLAPPHREVAPPHRLLRLPRRGLMPAHSSRPRDHRASDRAGGSPAHTHRRVVQWQ